jgi:hypothetical protein
MIDEVHVNVVPESVEVGRKFNVVALHISAISVEAEFVITGLGETVTITSTGVPGHPPAVGVMW